MKGTIKQQNLSGQLTSYKYPTLSSYQAIRLTVNIYLCHQTHIHQQVIMTYFIRECFVHNLW